VEPVDIWYYCFDTNVVRPAHSVGKMKVVACCRLQYAHIEMSYLTEMSVIEPGSPNLWISFQLFRTLCNSVSSADTGPCVSSSAQVHTCDRSARWSQEPHLSGVCVCVAVQRCPLCWTSDPLLLSSCVSLLIRFICHEGYINRLLQLIYIRKCVCVCALLSNECFYLQCIQCILSGNSLSTICTICKIVSLTLTIQNQTREITNE